VQREIEKRLTPFEEAVTLTQSVIGIQATAAAAIVAEIGTEMHRFPSDKHLARFRGHQPGNPCLQAMLLEVAWAIARTRDNYLSAFYHRVACRRGNEIAIMALAHKVLVILYHVLREKKPYTDLGADYFDKLDTSRIQRHHIRRLEQLGYTVTLTPG